MSVVFPARRGRTSCPAVLFALVVSGCCTGVASPDPAPLPTAPTAEVPSTTAPPTAPVVDDRYETESDRTITERVRTLFRQDFEIAAAQPRVRIATAQGVVTLTGDVETDRQRRVMTAHARATDGVSRVEDLLVLSP